MSFAPALSARNASSPTASPASVRKRDGSLVPFDGDRIQIAIRKAFWAEYGLAPEAELPAALSASARSAMICGASVAMHARSRYVIMANSTHRATTR